MRDVCRGAGVVYRSPHKLCHGHAVYALKHARTIAELKAISQNLMHADIKITDGVYGVLTDDDTRDIIAGLSGRMNGDGSGGLIDQMEARLQALKQKETLTNQACFRPYL